MSVLVKKSLLYQEPRSLKINSKHQTIDDRGVKIIWQTFLNGYDKNASTNNYEPTRNKQNIWQCIRQVQKGKRRYKVESNGNFGTKKWEK